jgi:Leu/Phe-tRNA-protein transferase
MINKLSPQFPLYSNIVNKGGNLSGNCISNNTKINGKSLSTFVLIVNLFVTTGSDLIYIQVQIPHTANYANLKIPKSSSSEHIKLFFESESGF